MLASFPHEITKSFACNKIIQSRNHKMYHTLLDAEDRKRKKIHAQSLCAAWFPTNICMWSSSSESAGRDRHVANSYCKNHHKKCFWCNVKRQHRELRHHRGRALSVLLGKMGESHQRMVLMNEQTCSGGAEKGKWWEKMLRKQNVWKEQREERGGDVWGNRNIAGKADCRGLPMSSQTPRLNV